MTAHALITGGQQGIGLGIARELAAAGFMLTLAADVAEDAPAVCEALASLPRGTRYIPHDVSHIDDLSAFLDRVEEAGPVTTLISNAGVSALSRGDLLDMRAESFDRCMAINLRGAFFLAQGVARRMIDLPPDPYRSLIFVTSVSAQMASPDRVEYCISKAGASMMARNFALRLAPEGIGVFELWPGITESAMTAPNHERYTHLINDGLVPARRWGTPRDVGRAAVPLATGQMAFATGTVIPVDGGLAIPRL